MSARTRWMLLGLLALAAAASGITMWGGDPLPPPLETPEARKAPDRVDHGSYKPKGWAHDYIGHMGATFGDGFEYKFRTRRGARAGAGRYKLTLEYGINKVGVLKKVSFAVSEDNETWTPVGEGRLVERDGWTLAQVRDVVVSDRIQEVRATETRTDGATWGVRQSAPQAPTVLGRVRDEIAGWPLLKHLPDLR